MDLENGVCEEGIIELTRTIPSVPLLSPLRSSCGGRVGVDVAIGFFAARTTGPGVCWRSGDLARARSRGPSRLRRCASRGHDGMNAMGL